MDEIKPKKRKRSVTTGTGVSQKDLQFNEKNEKKSRSIDEKNV